MIRFGFRVARSAASASSRRFARDVAASLVATGLGALALSHVGTVDPAAPPAAPAGKTSARLAALEGSFVEENVPVRATRIFDTVAMFSLPQVEPATWNETPVQMARIVAEPPPVLPAVRHRIVPQMVAAATQPVRPDAGRLAGVLPLARPIRIASASPPSAFVDPHRDRIRVFGWAVPGTDLLPSRRDAKQAVASVGSGAATIGLKAIDTVGDTASGIGRAASSAGSAVLDAVGLD